MNSKYAISPDASVREAMKRINDLSGEAMTLFAVDSTGRLLGSVTDGDIRRSLINGGDLANKISSVMNPDFLRLLPEEEASAKIAEGRKRHIELLPIVDKDGFLLEIIDLRVTKARLPLEAVLMAGGRGERLRPLTDDTPKPLLPVGGKAIIDYNVEDLEACGVKKIFVTVNYLAPLIQNHFEERKGRAEVTCVSEPKRLGTFGSLAYVEGIESQDIIVMNSDLLANIDFEAMYFHHCRSKADFTIAAVPYSVSVPFAIMRMQGNKVKSLEEKPTFNYFANGGVYMMKSSLIQEIKKGEYLDAPDFISSLIKAGKNVGCFHLNGTWIDIGSPDDYRLANELVKVKSGLEFTP